MAGFLPAPNNFPRLQDWAQRLVDELEIQLGDPAGTFLTPKPVALSHKFSASGQNLGTERAAIAGVLMYDANLNYPVYSDGSNWHPIGITQSQADSLYFPITGGNLNGGITAVDEIRTGGNFVIQRDTNNNFYFLDLSGTIRGVMYYDTVEEAIVIQRRDLNGGNAHNFVFTAPDKQGGTSVLRQSDANVRYVRKDTTTKQVMQASLGMGDNSITNLADPVNPDHAVNLRYANNNYFPITGGDLNGHINATGTLNAGGNLVIQRSGNNNLFFLHDNGVRKGVIYYNEALESIIIAPRDMNNSNEIIYKFDHGGNNNQSATVLRRTDGDARYQLSSSRAWKDDLTLTEPPQELWNIPLYSYTYGATLDENDPRRGHIGYGPCSEDIFQVFPEGVILDDDGHPRYLNASSLIGALMHKVKQLSDEINTLKQHMGLSHAKQDSEAKTRDGGGV